MDFKQYLFLRESVLTHCCADTPMPPAERVNPVVLAYIGDAVFSLYTRLRLAPSADHVRVLHDVNARMVSAVMQSKAMALLEKDLSEEEARAFHRGRNAGVSLPKSASPAEYHEATGFEALIGYLLLKGRSQRLSDILDRSFDVIAAAMAESLPAREP